MRPNNPRADIDRAIDMLENFFGGPPRPPKPHWNCHPWEQGFERPNFSGRNPNFRSHEDDEAFYLEMELPGIDENDLVIELQENELIIMTKNLLAEPAENEGSSRDRYRFKKIVTLPQNADPEAITAQFKNGLLTVNFAKKAKETKTRSIEIKKG